MSDRLRAAMRAVVIQHAVRRRNASVTALNPLTVTLEADTVAVPAVAITGYVPVADDAVQVLITPGSPPLILGPAPDTWHTVTSFSGTWTNTGGSNRKVGYRRTATGGVELAGWAKSTAGETAPSTIFTLPAGYRPDAAVIRGGTSGNAGGSQVSTSLVVNTSGTVQLTSYAGSVTWGNVGLEGYTFPLIGPA